MGTQSIGTCAFLSITGVEVEVKFKCRQKKNDVQKRKEWEKPTTIKNQLNSSY